MNQNANFNTNPAQPTFKTMDQSKILETNPKFTQNQSIPIKGNHTNLEKNQFIILKNKTKNEKWSHQSQINKNKHRLTASIGKQIEPANQNTNTHKKITQKISEKQ